MIAKWISAGNGDLLYFDRFSERLLPLGRADDKPPEKVYKYRPIDKNTISSLIQNELYFATQQQLNDPHDGGISLDISGTDEEWATFLRNSLRIIQAGLPWDAAEQFIAKDEHKNSAFRSKVYSSVTQFCREVGVCCFSEARDNTLMFAHYADGHRGVCLEFSTEKRNDAEFFGGLSAVQYIDEPKPVKFVSELPAMFLTKSASWSYEREWRALNDKGTLTYNYHPASLTGVIFGCKTSEEDKLLIRRIVGKTNQVQFYQAIKLPNTYSLEIKEISNNK
jgi:hypothetical protein